MIIHKSAVVTDSEIGQGTRVWQFASIIRGAKVGRDCNIASASIIDGASIGDRCLIGHGASLHPGTVIGNDVFVGPVAVFSNDRWPRVEKMGFDVTKLVNKEIVSIVVEDGASIGAGAIVLPGVVIGAGAMIAAGAVVDRSVPPAYLFKRDGSMCPIDPARPVCRMRAALAA